MKTLGIDPGTNSWKVSVYIEESNEFIDKVFDTKNIIENSQEFFKFIKSLNVDYIAAPSGYGLPLKKVNELTDDDLFKISLKKEEENSLGLRKILKKMKTFENAYVIPGVKFLPTVKSYKKFNLIDLGTPDKLCSAIYALSLSKNFKKENFIIGELGAFSAYIKVKNGKIVDGIGGSNSSSGYFVHGRIDKEFLYLNFDIKKFSGGFVDILKKSKDKRNVVNYFIYGILKDISSLMDSNVKKIYFSSNESFYEHFEVKIKKKLNARFKRNFSIYKLKFASSRGGAILMNGLFNGKFKDLIEWMKIKHAKGCIFDYIFF